MSLDISEMRPEDHAEVQALVGSEPPDSQVDQEPSTTVDRVGRYESVLSLVAREEGMIVGAILCHRHQTQGYMHRVALADPQRPSLAKMLVDRALRKLAAQGGCKCRIHLPQCEDQSLFWEGVKWDGRPELVQEAVPSSAMTDRMVRGSDGEHETDAGPSADPTASGVHPTA